MTTITTGLHILPQSLQQQVKTYWHDFQLACQQQQIDIPKHTDFIPSFCQVCACSEFVAQTCLQHPVIITELFTSGDILREYPVGEYAKYIQQQLLNVRQQNQLMHVLRLFRRREMLRIAWRDLANWADLNKTIGDLSNLADAIIEKSLVLLYDWQREKYGTPLDEKQRHMPLLVIAMGKLGSKELNFSSDIDLIFTYRADGNIAKTNDSHQQFFTRLTQQLIHVLHTPTADGFVYRVDARLRPYGTSGALVNSFASLDNYYRHHGRDWERYALVKARVIGGDEKIASQLRNNIRDFIYPRHINFSMIESMRQLQLVISQQVKEKGLENNVKRGPGGIREVEFIAQTYKLIHGGWYHHLQQRNTSRSLLLLRELGFLSDKSVEKLLDAYSFFRDLENRLQMFADKQTQRLPDNDHHQQRLLYAMQLPNWRTLLEKLHDRMHFVHHTFEALIAKPNLQFNDPKLDKLQPLFQQLWRDGLVSENINALLQQQGIQQIDALQQAINKLHNNQRTKQLNARQRQRLDEIIPHLLIFCTRMSDVDIAIQRIFNVVDALLSETDYLALLIENPIAIKHLVRLCSASLWITEQIRQFPSLLRELINPNTLYKPPPLEQLRQQLQEIIIAIPEDDIDAQLDAIRAFKQAHILRVAAADISDSLALMKISDYLTWIASVVLETIYHLATQIMVAQYGYPKNVQLQLPFIIIAYGKLGGIELGYASDLDLVFIHQDLDEQQLSTGKQPISLSIYYTRLAQQVIQLLGRRGRYGQLYEVDLRLRPSGESGLLVNSLTAFSGYQKQHAWLWEHQALVRARMIVGDSKLGETFTQLRRQILQQPRNAEQLIDAVRNMREKLRASRKATPAGQFHLKHGKGGIIDIEFLVQYLVLRWAALFPSLLQWTDNIRLLETIGINSLLPAMQVRLLSDAYLAYRKACYHANLQNKSATVDNKELLPFRQAVQQIYAEIIGY